MNRITYRVVVLVSVHFPYLSVFFPFFVLPPGTKGFFLAHLTFSLGDLAVSFSF